MAMSSSHHPQHDGQTEVTNKTLETMLRGFVSQDKSTWAEWLHLLEFAYNSNPHLSTGVSPYFLLYGFQPRAPLDFLIMNAVRKDRLYSTTPGANKFLEELNMHREAARLAVARAQVKQADHFNKGRRIEEFQVGSLVLVNPHSLEWVESKGEGAKLVQRWIGPFEVMEKINPKVYRLRMNDRYPGSPVFSRDHLKRYIQSPAEFGDRPALKETRLQKVAQDEYEVDFLVGHKYDKRDGKRKYLIRWKGYSPLHDTWEPERALRNAPGILREYKSAHGL
jgi:hypothetical protein